MKENMKKVRWSVVLLVLGLTFGLVVSCGGDGDGNERELSVELEWTSTTDVDLVVTEPTGQNVREATNGPSATSVGDNTCGFGSACDSGACTGSLTCGNRERIYADTVVVGGRYTVSVDTNASTSDENIVVFLTIPERWVQTGNSYYLRVDCTVPANTAVPVQIAYADFPARGSGTIGAEIAQVGCTVTDQRFR